MTALGYKEDLLFFRQKILDNHPGAVDDANPAFKEKIELCFAKAMQELDKVQSRSAVENFAKEFSDPMLFAFYKKPRRSYPDSLELDFESKKLSERCRYLRLPTFYSDTESFRKLLESILSKSPETWVIDVRSNTGGSPFLAKSVLEAIFGKEFCHSKLTLIQASETIEWRVSEDNIHYMERVKAQALTDGHQEEFLWARGITQGLLESLQKGQSLFSEDLSSKEEIKPAIPKFSGKIVALIDGRCSSTCLDFLDSLKALADRLILVGQPTSFDRTYRELREDVLPSGEGIMGYAIKVHRHRLRGDSEMFKPDIEIDWTSFDDKLLESWLCAKF